MKIIDPLRSLLESMMGGTDVPIWVVQEAMRDICVDEKTVNWLDNIRIMDYATFQRISQPIISIPPNFLGPFWLQIRDETRKNTWHHVGLNYETHAAIVQHLATKIQVKLGDTYWRQDSPMTYTLMSSCGFVLGKVMWTADSAEMAGWRPFYSDHRECTSFVHRQLEVAQSWLMDCLIVPKEAAIWVDM